MTTATPATRFLPSHLAAVRLAALGMHNSEIGPALGISASMVGVRLHRAGLHAGVGTRHGLVAQACRWGQLQDAPAQPVADRDVMLANLDLLAVLAAGLTHQEARLRLWTSRAAVETRTRRFRAAIGARNRAHAVLIAWQMRVLPEVER